MMIRLFFFETPAGLEMSGPAQRLVLLYYRYEAEVRRSFITTTVREESQVGFELETMASRSMPLPTWTRHPYILII